MAVESEKSDPPPTKLIINKYYNVYHNFKNEQKQIISK